MELAQKLAGYTLGTADRCGEPAQKKKKEVIDAEFENFSGGMQANGFSSLPSRRCGMSRPLLGLCFNKGAHRGIRPGVVLDGISQANYPAEYMAALLTSVRDDKDKSALYLNESRRMGIIAAAVGERVAGEFRRGRYRHPVRARGDPQ